MFVINIKEILKNKVTLIIFALITVLISVSIIVYTLSMKFNILRGNLIENIIERFGEKDNVLNMQNYYSEFEITVVSNKNVNTYLMKEWHKKGTGNRIEYLDSNRSKVSILTLNEKTIIQNENQKNIMVLDPYITKYTNVLSISTFLNIYEKHKEQECCFSANSYEKANNINMILDNTCKMGDSCDCETNELVKHVSKIELKLDRNSGKPLTYIVYDNDKKECISIVYNKFDINMDMKDSIFKE